MYGSGRGAVSNDRPYRTSVPQRFQNNSALNQGLGLQSGAQSSGNGWPDGSRPKPSRSCRPTTSFAIQLCLEEAVANIIMHGGMHGGGAKDDRLRIAIELERNAGTLVASIEDSGREFDPTQFPPPSVAKSLEEVKVGDLGIHLMHSFASAMHYERRDGRNRLTLRFVELH
jgi:serine/threonine-protein kinase RsbW